MSPSALFVMLALMGSASAVGDNGQGDKMTCQGDQKCNVVEADTFDEDTEQDETTLLAINHEIARHTEELGIDCKREQKKSKDFCLKCTWWGKKCVKEAKVCSKQCADCKKNLIGTAIGTLQAPDGSLKADKFGTVGDFGIQFDDSTSIDLGDGRFDELSRDGLKVLAKIWRCRTEIGVVTANGIQFNEKDADGKHIQWIRQINDNGSPGAPFYGHMYTGDNIFGESQSLGDVDERAADVGGYAHVVHEKDKLVIYKSGLGGKEIIVGQIRSDGFFLQNGARIL